MSSNDNWIISENAFDLSSLHHKETVFTIGNGYLSTRGAFEEGFPGERRSTFVHGIFDDAPVVFTELANTPDWLPLDVYLNGERFSMVNGQVESFQRSLDLRNGLLTRQVCWRSPSGWVADLTFERFASLPDPHLLLVRCRVEPQFEGLLEFRAGINACTDNLGLAHWQWLGQGIQDDIAYLHTRTRQTRIELAAAMRVECSSGESLSQEIWDAQNAPTAVVRARAAPGQAIVVTQIIALVSSRDTGEVVPAAVERVARFRSWPAALAAHNAAWEKEWERADVIIEGDDEVQTAIRFNLYHLLIAAPRKDDRVSIGAKTLSGYGYRGHSFWDTEIFMLPFFTHTSPHIARNLLTYRSRLLPGARHKAAQNGFEGAMFPWECASDGEEVTPKWVPDIADPGRLVRIWCGDIEIHISADIAFATHQYWRVTGDHGWFLEHGAELVMDTARFWASRAEWNSEAERYEYSLVIGPDEYHDRVDNNFFTNRMAQWNLQTALEVLAWLKGYAPHKASELVERLDLSDQRLAHWKNVIDFIYLPALPSGLVEQFDGYFNLKDVDLSELEPRSVSVQALFGIEGASQTQVIKQPDVLMLFYLLRGLYPEEVVRINYNYYTPRTDHTHGSSLGPAIQAIMACEMGLYEEAYEQFLRAARADLLDVRGNAGDGIHGASAGGLWQAIVFGFGGLRVTPQGWSINPRLPQAWKRLAFKFFHNGEIQEVDLSGNQPAGERLEGL
jgi:trehalose/maltose hydrolase-like predicted phosphorylase